MTARTLAVAVLAATLTAGPPAAVASFDGRSCPAAVSHQGIGAPHPPNSVPALKWAAKRTTWTETDTFLTRDDVPMLVHQPKLGGHDITKLTFRQVRNRVPHVATLGEGLRAVKAYRGRKLLVEVKRMFPWAEIADRITANKMARRTTIYSQSSHQMAALKAAHPDIRVGSKARAGTWAKDVAKVGALTTLAPSDLTRERVTNLHKRGVRTVIARRGPDSPQSWSRMARAGVDGQLTNRLTAYRQEACL